MAKRPVSKQVYVGIGEEGRIVRIFKGYPDPKIKLKVEMTSRSKAVSAIREQVFKRANGACEFCGGLYGSGGHLHEKKFRSLGGEISLENSVAICPGCHRKEHKV